ncbi:hypothetical protein ACTI_25890 [Actinoplanes sp. OR16]|uniref:hypothetical protein n=1 Tax=Actinoplanes sp. OR16 TaxID=946334 RepID=UPI000F716C0C|nr:hypothetical protein [Actinoplanes sp. OR16]BBH65904.1 hypothetical protein ACTI_25890 [Actinoplanes sp. OR16]
MGDFPINLVSAPERFRFGRVRAWFAGIVTVGACLGLAGGAPPRAPAAIPIAGVPALPALPESGSSWAPAPVTRQGLTTLASSSGTRLALHTAGGDRTFLAGVNLGSTTPGFQPGELSITASQYRNWLAAMGRLGIRAVRTYTIHPPAFYRELARHNLADPDRPIYLFQGVAAISDELRDAVQAVTGELARPPKPGRAGGVWDADVTPWLAAWIIDPEGDHSGVSTGRYFHGTGEASPDEQRLAATMDELAGRLVALGLSRPIAFVSSPRLSAGHVRATGDWPGGTFAGYPDPSSFTRRDDLPILITEVGVPSSIGSSGSAPLGHSRGDHSERDALRIDAEMLLTIHRLGLSGGFLAGWADEWFKSAWNTASHQDPARRQLWHDALTSEQHSGLLAFDPAVRTSRVLLDTPDGWPARRVTAEVDDACLRLGIRLRGSRPHRVTIGFDLLPEISGTPGPGSGDHAADVVFELDLIALSGQAYLREALDPLPVDHPGDQISRGPAPSGWRRYELLTGRSELQNAGLLRHGDGEETRALWRLAGDDLTVRAPWALLGFADPSAHRVLVPAAVSGQAARATRESAGMTVTVSASGTDQATGRVTWPAWNRPLYTERLKRGASELRDAVLTVTASAAEARSPR